MVDSREVGGGIRRRRRCGVCGRRFTTMERLVGELFVIKRDGRREEFSRSKLLTGIRKACEKRPLPAGKLEKVTEEIENKLLGLGRREVSSSLIGDMVMDKLKQLDPIAYIRFASVYLQFADLKTLKEAVDSLLKEGHAPQKGG